jgi:mRNA interferase RelE/StbE
VAYQIEFAPHAYRQFKKPKRDTQLLLLAKIEGLSTNPRPAGVKKLASVENLYRIRVGDYRVVYEIRDRALIIVVVKVGHRRDVYT